MPFSDRIHAGRLLAPRLQLLSPGNPLVVVALARGGVPIGHEIARFLGVPLEVLVVRKIGAPSQPEYGIGAVTEEGYFWINQEAAEATGTSPSELEGLLHLEQLEVERRIARYRDGRPFPRLEGKTVILADDGLATGVSARVAGRFLKEARGADRVIFAAPVCSPGSARFLRKELDQVICLEEPEDFDSVGQFYEDFNQTTDEEVLSLLSAARTQNVLIGERGLELPGSLAIPADAQGLVLFAHGSGSSRLSPRNIEVAEKLNEAGLGTLLFDLLTEEEALGRGNVFDIGLLASRLGLATRWLRRQPAARGLELGYFGASTGAAAALWAASEPGAAISAIVSRGGRPDLAIPRLAGVGAPTLLLVGEKDGVVLELNEEAIKHLKTSSLIIIPGATHLFEEPGALQAVAEEAVNWFTRYLKKKKARDAA